MSTAPLTSPITLLICALGGEGGGVLSEWLMEVAQLSGYAAQSTSIPGVAQRTGATTYYVEVFPKPLSELQGQKPVLSLYPVPGMLDVLISSELLETARQISLGMTSPERTQIISSSARSLTTLERMQPSDGRLDSAALLQLVRDHSQEHHVLDMGELSKQAGTIVSAVMLGALAASDMFPFPRSAYQTAIQSGGSTAAASWRGFELGWAKVQEQRSQLQRVRESLQSTSVLGAMPSNTLANPQASADDTQWMKLWLEPFPSPLHDMIKLGLARLVDYQGRAYAKLYIDRLQQVQAAEQAADPQLQHGWSTTREMARWLALWMAFDDIVRVADLKSRPSRMARVQQEVKSGPKDLLYVYDHFKPGIPELAGLLPKVLAQPLLRWDRSRAAQGRKPWALPLKIGTHSVSGMLALRTLASFKALRPWSSRYATEQALINEWLQAVVTSTRAQWASGHEVALCGQLIKGYGSTNERGKDHLLHVVRHLSAATLASPEIKATALREARLAALADESGKQLDQTLLRHGAPVRNIAPQPIRWMRKPKAT